MTKTIIDLGQAEQKAKQRDLEIEKQQFIEKHNGVDQGEVDEALKILSKASGGKEIYIATKKSPQSRVKFVQFIQDNWAYALETKYFSDEEMLFLLRIQRFVQFKSNCIVDDIHSRSAVPMTQKEITERLKTDKSKVSRLLKSLQNKGVIVKTRGNQIEGNNVRTNAIFLNPNFMYCGDRDNVEVTLKALFTHSKSILKDFPIALF
ncbi:helix-turn-helix domain-containing protein [Bacillus toyonensis]|uniref:helix-turn-helix domain-containing protein n=1 Tax=Bacillus toyonensis TaxID=155322 RepID=UPI00301A5F4C